MLNTCAEPLSVGPYVLGRVPARPEHAAAPVVVRMLATLPAIRSLDLIAAARTLGLGRLAAWLDAVGADPARCCEVDVTPTYCIEMARKMYVSFDGPVPPPSVDPRPGAVIGGDASGVRSGVRSGTHVLNL